MMSENTGRFHGMGLAVPVACHFILQWFVGHWHAPQPGVPGSVHGHYERLSITVSGMHSVIKPHFFYVCNLHSTELLLIKTEPKQTTELRHVKDKSNHQEQVDAQEKQNRVFTVMVLITPLFLLAFSEA